MYDICPIFGSILGTGCEVRQSFCTRGEGKDVRDDERLSGYSDRDFLVMDLSASKLERLIETHT